MGCQRAESERSNLVADMVKPFSGYIGDLEYWAQPATFRSVHKCVLVTYLTHLSLANIGASSIAISADLTKTGVLLRRVGQRYCCGVKVKTYRHPGLFKILTTCLTVSSMTFGGVMSIYFEALLGHIKCRCTQTNHLRYADDDGDSQSEGSSEVLLGHPNETCVGSYYQDNTRWGP